ncbi:MAG: methyltransferase domain-containing protein [Planctomycetaceae bacterium]|jgi:ubiquinone/menaquinone biosynthesis C-methylase UbiE|nr:methyltransferase domain-containing protein [Planctomycetaceae bacterium]
MSNNLLEQEIETISIRELKELYQKGVNISEYLRNKYDVNNTPHVIEIAYDLQAGSYTADMEKLEIKKWRENVGAELVNIIRSLLPTPESILEAGIGEGNQLSVVLSQFQNTPVASYGFDISWSRVAFARKWLNKQGNKNTTLFTGNLLNIPCADNAVDIVYTNQAIEPNRGNEESILKELFRITKKYLILIEPSYELANDEGKQRMNRYGYVTGLQETAVKLGFDVLEYRLCSYYFNPLNPTAVMIIQKKNVREISSSVLADPLFKTPLYKKDNVLFSPDSLRVYPIVDGIPCLRIENGIIASKYELFKKSNK